MNQLVLFGHSILLDAASAPESRVLGFDAQFLQEVGFIWVNTAVLVAVLAFILYKPVKTFMEKRADRIRAQIVSAENTQNEAMALKEEYAQKVQEIDKERIEILDEARKKAIVRSEEIIRDARKEADIIRGHAKSDIALEIERVQHEMNIQLIELSTTMAGTFIKSSLTSDEHERLVSKALADLGDIKWAK